jgi:hypothetical protein
VRQLLVSGATLRPHKLAVIVTMTRELTEASNIEEIVRVLLTEAAGLALDAAIFSSTAASSACSAGLFNGLTPVAASTTGSAFDAAGIDLGALVNDIASRGGGANAFIVAAPSQAMGIRFYSPGGTLEANLAASAGMSDKTVAAIEPSSLAVAIGAPEFSVNRVAAISHDDAAPGFPSGPPVKSMFQIDGVALKMELWAAWAMRAPHVSFMSGVEW